MWARTVVLMAMEVHLLLRLMLLAFLLLHFKPGTCPYPNCLNFTYITVALTSTGVICNTYVYKLPCRSALRILIGR